MMKFFASGQEQTGGDILPLQVLAFDLEDSDRSGKNHNQTENLQNLSRIYSKNRPFHEDVLPDILLQLFVLLEKYEHLMQFPDQSNPR